MEFEKEQVWKRISEVGNYESYYCQASDAERKQFRQWAKSLMWEQSVTIEFTKSDGSLRVMHCTLSDLYGAKYPDKNTITENKNATTKEKNDSVCCVWDIEKESWRSFRWDRLKRIDFAI